MGGREIAPADHGGHELSRERAYRRYGFRPRPFGGRIRAAPEWRGLSGLGGREGGNAGLRLRAAVVRQGYGDERESPRAAEDQRDPGDAPTKPWRGGEADAGPPILYAGIVRTKRSTSGHEAAQARMFAPGVPPTPM